MARSSSGFNRTRSIPALAWYSNERMSEDNVQPTDKSENSAKDAQQPESQPPTTATPVNVAKEHPKEHTDNSNADEKKREREPLSYFEIITIVLAGIGIIVAAGTGVAIYWQDKIASSTLNELQKEYPKFSESADAAKRSADIAEHSFEMERRRAEDTEQAIISESSGQFYVFKNVYYVDLGNSGKVTARNISANIEIFLTALPRNQRIRSLGTVNITAPQLEEGKDLRHTLNLPLTTGDWNNIADTKEAITESGHFRYENGFDRTIENKVCNVWIYFRTPEDKLNPVQGRGSICDRLADLLASYPPKRPQ